ncbi:hypothetical protein ABXJ56_06675 [Microbacterium chocolatum]|uniref:hypothetical protein n=1 Tax=Microbacterium aurantiacum TaxID=162393 RepID=UPI003390472B
MRDPDASRDPDAPVVIIDPGPHGVAVHGRAFAQAVIAADPRIEVRGRGDLTGLPPGVPIHAQFTDRLWADSLEEALAAFEAVADRHPISVTLHDVPQESDGERNLPRRRAVYAAVAARARGVVVNSAHERALLAEHDVWDGPVAVIPLPVGAPVSGERPEPDGSVGILGYFYPGKGHDEAAEAAVRAGVTRLTVLGRASDGHADDLAAFVARAAGRGLSVEVTGWLDDDAMAARCRTVSVPVIAHRHVSASGSLSSWIAWGRRPLAVENRYIREMATLRPGTIAVTAAEDLAGGIRAARDRSATTWHDVSALPMDGREVAEAYLAWWGAST